MAKIHQSVEIAPEARAMFLKRYRSTWNIGLEITSKIVARFSKETRSKGLVCVGRCGGGVGKGGGGGGGYAGEVHTLLIHYLGNKEQRNGGCCANVDNSPSKEHPR